MASYIQTLLSQLNDVDVNDASMTKTLDPVGQDDRVLGVCPDDLKRLKVHIHHIMVRQNALEKKIRILKIEHEGDETPPEGFERLAAETLRLAEEYDMLDKLFWFALRHHFSEKGGDAPSIGIRQGWQLVSFNASEGASSASLKALIRKVLEDM